MSYRSLADLNDTIPESLYRLPRDIDLVVGIPRSGLLDANLFRLLRNIFFTDIESFLKDHIYASGTTKRHAGLDRGISEMRRILILDDSISGGNAMRMARKRVEDCGFRLRTGQSAAYLPMELHVSCHAGEKLRVHRRSVVH